MVIWVKIFRPKKQYVTQANPCGWQVWALLPPGGSPHIIPPSPITPPTLHSPTYTHFPSYTTHIPQSTFHRHRQNTQNSFSIISTTHPPYVSSFYIPLYHLFILYLNIIIIIIIKSYLIFYHIIIYKINFILYS